MWHHGRKIINALFKKRTTSPAVRVEFESKIQADSDRSDIRVFEAPLSAEQYGDYEQGTGTAAQEKESRRLIVHIENCYYYANDYIAVTDVSADGDNVLTDGKNLYFIDPIIKFKKPAVEVLEHYYKLLR